MVYPGGKSGAGVYQTLINLMPRHEIYIEAFLGGGAVMKYKKPARMANIGIDADSDVIKQNQGKAFTAIHADAISWLAQLAKDSLRLPIPICLPQEILIYLDPPYLMDTRSSHRPIYRCELSDDDHRRLLEIITADLPFMVMISGYASEMYDTALHGWRRVTYQAMTHGGPATEVVWMNFEEPFELHDYRFLGRDFRERERIKRKKLRWQARLAQMDIFERAALMEALRVVRSPASPYPELLQAKPTWGRNKTIAEMESAAIVENCEIPQL